MCRGLGVEGYDDPRYATIAERIKHHGSRRSWTCVTHVPQT